jgi:uncharacterized membrane protein YfcA
MLFLLLAIGITIAAFGSLIGAGGGFLLVPVLLHLYPEDPPALIAATSMAVVLCTTVSGTLAYARMGRIDYKSGALFSLAIFPGAILGAVATHFVRRALFESAFGTLLIFLALQILKGTQASAAGETESRRWIRRNFSDRYGERFDYGFRRNLALWTSFVVGFLANLFGIGGGPIQVPVLVRWLGFPVTVATATSQFVTAIMASAGVVAHLVMGSYAIEPGRVMWLALGAVIGGQIGPVLALRIRSVHIVRILAAAITLIGAHLIYQALLRL